MTCTNNTPPWFTGHWKDWHRGHGCDKDDGRTITPAGRTEIDQHEAWGDDRLTDAQISMLRARTTSGDVDMCKALDELVRLRAACRVVTDEQIDRVLFQVFNVIDRSEVWGLARQEAATFRQAVRMALADRKP